jgi:hypothetical protein
MKRILIPLLLAVMPLSLPAAETGYRIVHPDGTVEFTDDPHSGGEPIELRQTPTYQSNPPTAKPDSRAHGTSRKEKEDQAAGYRSLTIISPSQDQTLWFDGSGVRVSVQVSPELSPGHEVVVEMDGSEVARGPRGRFTLERVFRGSHTLHARIEDEDGTILIDSRSITFHMRQHSTR